MPTDFVTPDYNQLYIEESILKPLRAIKAYPESGYGSIVLNIQGHKIINLEKKESIKL